MLCKLRNIIFTLCRCYNLQTILLRPVEEERISPSVSTISAHFLNIRAVLLIQCNFQLPQHPQTQAPEVPKCIV